MLRRLIVACGIVGFAGLAIAVVALAGGPDPDPEPPPAADGSTLASTWVDPDADGVLAPGSAEALAERTDLAPASPPVRTLATMAQITDAHVRDEESPARAPLVDRLSQTLNSSFRPQEALTPQVLEATVRSVDALEADAVLETGDLIDSAQLDELRQALAVLGGGEVDPDSGAPGYDGVQELSNPDPFIYRPDLDAPRHPGLLELAARPFVSPGLDAPWYPALGNHDLLVQGEVPSNPQLERIATGDRELVRLARGLKAPREPRLSPGLVDRYLAGGLPGKTVRVPADAARRHLRAAEAVAMLRDASAAPDGGSRLDYEFDAAPRVRVIVLDLVRRGGGSDGSLRPGQLEWLDSQLRAAGERYVIVVSHQPLAGSAGGELALAALDRDPDVIAAISGHTHRNSIEPRPTAAGGYWLISTASLTDYPQQARALRVIETEDGVGLETWMLDSAPGGLGDTARELAYLDAGGGRPQGLAGAPTDRNARLFLARPGT